MAELGELFYSAGIKIDEREYNKLTNLATVLNSIKGERTVMLKVDGGYVKEGLNKFKQRVDSFVKQTEESTKIKLSIDASDFKIGKNLEAVKNDITTINSMLQELQRNIAPTFNDLKIKVDASEVAKSFGMVNEYAMRAASAAKGLKESLDIAFSSSDNRLVGFANSKEKLAEATKITAIQTKLKDNLEKASKAIQIGLGSASENGADVFKSLMSGARKTIDPMIEKYEGLSRVIRTLKDEMIAANGGAENATTRRMASSIADVENLLSLLRELRNLQGKTLIGKSENLKGIIGGDSYTKWFSNEGFKELNTIEKRVETAFYNLGSNVSTKAKAAFKSYLNTVNKEAGKENLASINVVVNGFTPAVGAISSLRATINKYLNESYDKNPLEINNISVKQQSLKRLADTIRESIQGALMGLEAAIKVNAIKGNTLSPSNLSDAVIPETPSLADRLQKKRANSKVESETISPIGGGIISGEKAKIPAEIDIKTVNLDELSNEKLNHLYGKVMSDSKMFGITGKLLDNVSNFLDLSVKDQLRLIQDAISKTHTSEQPKSEASVYSKSIIESILAKDAEDAKKSKDDKIGHADLIRGILDRLSKGNAFDLDKKDISYIYNQIKSLSAFSNVRGEIDKILPTPDFNLNKRMYLDAVQTYLKGASLDMHKEALAAMKAENDVKNADITKKNILANIEKVFSERTPFQEYQKQGGQMMSNINKNWEQAQKDMLAKLDKETSDLLKVLESTTKIATGKGVTSGRFEELQNKIISFRDSLSKVNITEKGQDIRSKLPEIDELKSQVQRITNVVNGEYLHKGSDRPIGIPELREGMSTAGGGKVVGKGTATSDSILLHASNGEWVMNAAATKMFEPFLLAANQMGRGEVNIGHVVDTLRSMGLSNSTVNTIAVGELFVSAQNVSVTGHVAGDRGGKAHKDKGNEIWRESGGPVSSNNNSQKNWTKQQRSKKFAEILGLKTDAEELVKTRNQAYNMMDKESSQIVRDRLKALVDNYDKQIQEKKQALESKIQEYNSRAGKSFKENIDFDKLFNLKGPKAPAAPKTASLDKFDSTKEKVLGKITNEVDKIESNPSLLQGNKALQNRLDLYKSLQVEVNALKKDEAGLARLNEINGRVTGMGASSGVISQARQGAAFAARMDQMAAAAADEQEQIKANFANRINAIQRQNDVWGATEAGKRINATAISENKELLERMTDIKNRNDVEMMKRFMALPLSLKNDGTLDEKYLREWREVAGFKHTIGAINEKERLRIEAEEARRAKEEAANNMRFRGAVDKRGTELTTALTDLDNFKRKANNALAIFNKPATVTMGDGAAAHTTTVNAAASQQLANGVLATLKQIEKGKLRDIPAVLEQVKNQIKNDLQQSGKLFNQAYKDAREDAKQQSVGKQLNLRNDQESTRLQGLIDRVNTTITTPDPQRAGTGKYLREVVTDATDAITKLQVVQQELNKINQIADPTQRKQELAKFATDINKLLGDVTTAFSNAQNTAKNDALNQSNRAKATDQFYKDLKDANDKIAKEYGKYQNALNLFNNPESFKRGRWNIVTDATDALNIISKIKAELDAISVKTGQDKINAINNAVNSGLFDTLRKDAGTAYSKARKDALDTAVGLDNIDKADAKKAADAQRALVAAQKAFNAQIGKLDSEIGNLMQRRGALIGAGKGYGIIESRIGELENIKATSIATVNPNDIASLEAETKALQDNLKARRELTAQRKEEQKNANKPTPPTPPVPPVPPTPPTPPAPPAPPAPKGGPTPPTPPVPPGSNPIKVNAELKKQEGIAHRLNQQLKRLRADRDKGQEFGKETAEIDKVIKKYEQLLDVVRRFNNSGKLMRGMDATKFFRSLTTQTKVARDADAMIDKQTADWARATNTQKGFESQTLQTLKSVFSLDQQFSMLASNIQNAFSIYALQQFAHSIIQIGGELERQQLAMGSIFGDARKAESIYQDVADLSMKSPFDVQDLLKNTKQLSAFGVEYQDLYDWTKRLSDIAAAVGVDFSRIGYEFGQMISMDYLDARHLRMFSMSGIPLIQQLTEHYSQQQGREVGVEEVRKMISKREVGADVVKDILKDMTNEGGKFYNMQEVMAESLASKWRNLSNAQNLMYGELAKSGWGEFLKSIAEGLTAVTKQWDTLGTSVLGVAVAMTAWRTTVTIANFLTGKQTISAMAAAMASKELTAAEIRQVKATNILNAAELDHLKTHHYLTTAAAKRILTSKKLTSAQFAELASTLNLSRGQVIAALSTQTATASTKKLVIAQIAARLHATGLNKTIAVQCAWLIRMGGIGSGIARIWASIGGVIASNPWTAGIAAVATAIGLFVWWRKEADKLKDSLDEIDQNSKNNSEQEAEAMRELVRRATDHNTALEDRKTAQEQLMSQFGEYFKDIDLESAAYADLTENVEAATRAIQRKAEVTAAEDKVKKIVENRENELGFQDDFMNKGLGYKLKKRLTGYNAGIGDGGNMARYIINMLRDNADVSDEEIERAVSKRWDRFKTFGLVGSSVLKDIRNVIKTANEDIADAINPTGLSDVWIKEIESISAAYDEAIAKEKEHNRQLELEAEKNETIFKLLSLDKGVYFAYDINGKTYKGQGIGLKEQDPDVKRYKENAEKQRKLLSRDWAMVANEVVYDWNVDKTDMKRQFASRNGFEIGVSAFSSALAPKSDQEFIVWAAETAKKKKEVEDELNKWNINPQTDEASLRSVATLEEEMARILEIESRLGISFEDYAKGDKASKKEADDLNKRIDNLKRAYDEYKRLVAQYGKTEAGLRWKNTERYRREFAGISIDDLEHFVEALKKIYNQIPRNGKFNEALSKTDELIVNVGIDIDHQQVTKVMSEIQRVIEEEMKQWDFFRTLMESGVSRDEAAKLALGGIAERMSAEFSKIAKQKVLDAVGERAEAEKKNELVNKTDGTGIIERGEGTLGSKNLLELIGGKWEGGNLAADYRANGAGGTEKFLTIGYGHVVTKAEEGNGILRGETENGIVGTAQFIKGQQLSQSEAEALFWKDIQGNDKGNVQALVDALAETERYLTQNMIDSLLSFEYNLGSKRLEKGSSLWNAFMGHYGKDADGGKEAINAVWQSYNKVKQDGRYVFSQGLQNRRKRETDYAWSESPVVSEFADVAVAKQLEQSRMTAIQEASKADIFNMNLEDIDKTFGAEISIMVEDFRDTISKLTLGDMGITDASSYLAKAIELAAKITGVDSGVYGGDLNKLYAMTLDDEAMKNDFNGYGSLFKTLVEKWKSEQDRELQERQKLVQEALTNLNSVYTAEMKAFEAARKQIEAINANTALTPEEKQKLIQSEVARYKFERQERMAAGRSGILGITKLLSRNEALKQAGEALNSLIGWFKDGNNGISATDANSRIDKIVDNYLAILQDKQAKRHEGFADRARRRYEESRAARQDFLTKQQQESATEGVGEDLYRQYLNLEGSKAEQVAANYLKQIWEILNDKEAEDPIAKNVTAEQKDKEMQSKLLELNKKDLKKRAEEARKKPQEKRTAEDWATIELDDARRAASAKSKTEETFKWLNAGMAVASTAVEKFAGDNEDAKFAMSMLTDGVGLAADVFSGNWAEAAQKGLTMIIEMTSFLLSQTSEWLKAEEEAAKERAEAWKGGYEELSSVFDDTGHNSYITLRKIAALNTLFVAQLQSIGSDVSSIEQQVMDSNSQAVKIDFSDDYRRIAEGRDEVAEDSSFLNNTILSFKNKDWWANWLTGGVWGLGNFLFDWDGNSRKEEYWAKVEENIKAAEKALLSFINVSSVEEANQKLNSLRNKGDVSTLAYIAGYQDLINQRKEVMNELASQEAQKGKDRDEAAIKEYRDQLKELNKEIVEYVHNFASEVYDLDLYSWAETISDALVEAFKNGEDAAEKFHDTVNDLLEDVWNKVIQHVVFDPLINQIDEKLFGKEDENGVLKGGIFSDGAVDDVNVAVQEAVKWLADWKDANGEQVTNLVESLFDAGKSIGLYEDESGSSTSASIQGMTEETADILAAYINGMRADLSYQRSEVELIRQNTDLMLEEMRNASPIAAIAELPELAMSKAVTDVDYEEIPNSGTELADTQKYVYGILQYSASGNELLKELSGIALPEINAVLDSQLEQLIQQTDHLDAINAHTAAMMEFTESLDNNFKRVMRGDEYLHIK